LANDADLQTGAGDPLDLGLLRHASEHGVAPEKIRARHPRVGERPFDSAWKFARVTVREDGGAVSYLKGAPEVILPRCDGASAGAAKRAHRHAGEGFRVLALAWGKGEREEGLTFIGFALFWDPARAEVPAAMEK